MSNFFGVVTGLLGVLLRDAPKGKKHVNDHRRTEVVCEYSTVHTKRSPLTSA